MHQPAPQAGTARSGDPELRSSTPEQVAAAERSDPPRRAPERVMLESWLDFHRATLLTKCAGLTDEQLRRRSVPPSTLSLLGLVRHLTEVERYWLRTVLLGEQLPDLYWTAAEPDGDVDGVADADVAADLATYRATVAACRLAATSVTDLDAPGARRRHGEEYSLRWILCHLLEEYARHNGHADLLREAVDGVTGE